MSDFDTVLQEGPDIFINVKYLLCYYQNSLFSIDFIPNTQQTVVIRCMQIPEYGNVQKGNRGGEL